MCDRNPKCLAVAAVLAGLLVLAGRGPAAAQAQSHPPQMRLQVVDADTGQPVPGVKVRAWVRTNLVTDETGACSFPLPQPGAESFAYRITLSKDGYVGKYLTWSKSQNDRVEDIPAQYTATMEKGAAIGGIVKNENGEPVPGARVIISGPPPTTAGERERSVVAPNFHAERTDDAGRWHYSEAPRDFRNLTFRVVHPDYLPAVFGCEGPEAADPGIVQLTADDFRSGAVVMLLGHGIVLTGVVVDSAGKPVAEAAITRNHEWRNPAAALVTDAEGRFQIPNLRAGDLILTLQAKGLAAQTRLLTLSNGMPELKIEMKPGHVLQGKVVDETGQPIAGAAVRTDRADLGPLEYDWSTVTDADGHFLWDSAPEGGHPYYVTAQGYHARSEPMLLADGHPKIIILRKAGEAGKTYIDGRVAEAGGNSPVGKFTVCVTELKGRSVSRFRKSVTDTNGAYSIAVDAADTVYRLEIQAAGCLPQYGNRKSPGDGDQRMDFALEKGAALTGHVYLADDRPAAGAEVALCTVEEGAWLGHCRFEDHFDTNLVETTDDGGFVFAPRAGAHVIYAAQESGFGELDIEGATPPYRVTLAPWGGVAGTARSGSRALSGQKLALVPAFGSLPGQRGLSFSVDDFAVTTDADGKFIFSNVPPMEVKLCRLFGNACRNEQFLVVKPGETTTVQYGGTGRLLTGRLAAPGYDGTIDWTNGQDIRFSAIVAEPPLTAKDPEARMQEVRRFFKSAEGRAWQRAHRSCGVTIETNGAFRIEDVPAGDYQLDATLRHPPAEGGEPIASLSTNVTVPAGGGGPDTPMDLGKIDLLLKKALKLGDLAPAFAIQTVDGRPLRLSDFRGKYVLLDFWATWCGPCVAETPHLKALYDAFGGNARFAMIGLSLDGATDAPKEYARKNGIQWTQGFLGEWSKSTVTPLYGVEGIPAIFLLGPDGKIIGRDLRGEAIRDAVEKALGR